MNEILAWMEQENIPLTEEQKTVLMAFQQELTELRQDVEQRQMAQLMEEELARQKVKNSRLLWALLDKDKLRLEDGELVGLKEQLKQLKEDEDTAFLFESQHQQPQFVALGKTVRPKENGARAVMGLKK